MEYNATGQKEYVEILFENGDIYKGEVENYKFSGYGLYHKKDKFTYAGEFKNSLFHGLGRYWEPEKIMIYQGEFQLGKKHGSGRLVWYRNNISYGPLVPQQSEVTNKSYKTYIRDKIMAQVKTELEQNVTKVITTLTNDYTSMDSDLIKEHIEAFNVTESDIDDLK